MGDCALIEDKPLPCTAQAADQEVCGYPAILPGNREVRAWASRPADLAVAWQTAHDNAALTTFSLPRQAKYLSEAFNTTAKGKDPSPFVYVHRGMLAYVGR